MSTLPLQNPGTVSKVQRLAGFLARKFANFDEVQRGVREDWGQDSVKIVHHKSNFSNFLLGDINQIVPITFEAWPSLSCDARCPLCTYSINNARSDDDKTPLLTFAKTDVYQNVIRKLAHGGVRSVTLTGGGEPLLNPDFGQIIKAISESGMKWGMFTHGLHLRESLVRSILEHPPKFLRVSLNSSSPETHAREYRMGADAYDKVLENVVRFATAVGALPLSFGVGYAVDPKTTDAELVDIGKCLVHLRDRTSGKLNYASFRPKVVYFNRDGSSRYTQVRHDEYAHLPNRIKSCIHSVLGDLRASGIRLDIKHHQFQNISDRRVFQNGLGLSWVSQIDHLGRGFLLSELNGSPWPDATYGTYASEATFDEVWFGSHRIDLTKRYQSGQLKVPLNLKTAHVDFLLEEIREKFGIFTHQEVDALWSTPEMTRLNGPRNWDFL